MALSDISLSVFVSLALAALSLLVRMLTPNRLVRRKLRLPPALALLFPVAAVALAFSSFEPAVIDSVRGIANLGLAPALITFGLTVLANPLRVDQLPTAVPNIVQDALVVGLFLLASTMLLQEKFLTTSAVGAVVLGFALQDTLGFSFSGLAIQIEKPFHVGQWIRVGEHEGRVEEITWRATKLRTKATNFVIVPNSVIAKEAIINYSEPVIPTRVEVDVGASYDAAPDLVKAGLNESLANTTLVLRDSKPNLLLLDFGASAITYRARFWIKNLRETRRPATKHAPTCSTASSATASRFPGRSKSGTRSSGHRRERRASLPSLQRCWGAARSSRRSTKARASPVQASARSGCTQRARRSCARGSPADPCS